MQDKVRDYLRLESEIDKLNSLLKTKRSEKDAIGTQICTFCRTKRTGAINLPDGSCLKLCNNTKYQSLTYSLLEKKIGDFNASNRDKIPTKEFIKFLKSERESKTSTDMRHIR